MGAVGREKKNGGCGQGKRSRVAGLRSNGGTWEWRDTGRIKALALVHHHLRGIHWAPTSKMPNILAKFSVIYGNVKDASDQGRRGSRN